MRFGSAVALSVILLVAACGQTDDTSAPVADTPTASSVDSTATASVPEPEPTATSAPAPEPTATSAPAPEPDPTATSAPESTVDEAVTDDVSAADVYDAPGALEVPLPLAAGAPGEIIDTEQLDVAGTGLRLLYHSTSATGDDVAVSGFVLLPEGEPPEGGWPLVAWAHGTTGLGDSCAPSHNAETDQLAIALTSFGFAVVATDYEGLGTPGVHPYVVGPSQAHSVLDSVRAVRNLDLPVTDRWLAFGHSQGGHAAMFTAQLQPSYAPELELIGTIAGAPPSQIETLNDSLIGSDFQGYLVMTASGLAAAYDNLDLADVFTPEAIDLLDVVETGCTAEIFDVFNPLDYATVSAVADPFQLEDWSEAIAIQETSLLPTTAPLLIIHGGDDEQIPVETSATLFERLCGLDGQAETVRIVYPGQSHAGVLTNFVAVPDILAFAQGRFAGAPADDQCGAG